MAPKAIVAQIAQLLEQLKQGPGPGAKGAAGGRPQSAVTGGAWECPHCPPGKSNWAHRTSCFRCGRERHAGAEVGSTVQPSAAPTMPKPARARSLGAPASVAPPKATVAGGLSPPPAAEDHPMGDPDPIGTELSLARAHHEWARKLQGEARASELPRASARLAKADLADKEIGRAHV